LADGDNMMIIDATNLYQIRQAGIEILNRELGPVAMIRFLQQYQKGYGDYSKERHDWIDKVSISDIVEQIKSRRKQQA
jgi:hypothetical protein